MQILGTHKDGSFILNNSYSNIYLVSANDCLYSIDSKVTINDRVYSISKFYSDGNVRLTSYGVEDLKLPISGLGKPHTPFYRDFYSNILELNKIVFVFEDQKIKEYTLTETLLKENKFDKLFLTKEDLVVNKCFEQDFINAQNLIDFARQNADHFDDFYGFESSLKYLLHQHIKSKIKTQN